LLLQLLVIVLLHGRHLTDVHVLPLFHLLLCLPIPPAPLVLHVSFARAMTIFILHEKIKRVRERQPVRVRVAVIPALP
jgi:hypothetical protein